MRLWGPGPTSVPASPTVVERIRGVEVPVLTETKRRLGRGEVGSALTYAYPKVVEDLGRAYAVEIPAGFSHEEIVARVFDEAMAPELEFFDRLYRLYAPVRFGGRTPTVSSDEVFELVRSLYSPEPMWRLYLTGPEDPAGPTEATSLPALARGPRAVEG